MDILSLQSISLLLTSIVVAGQLILPPQRTTGGQCITVGEVVNYTCTISDSSTADFTRWVVDEELIQELRCSIVLRHSDYESPSGDSGSCDGGRITARSVGVSGSDFTSMLTINITIDDGQRVIVCQSQHQDIIGIDRVQVGVIPAAPVDPMCNFTTPGETFSVSWSPPPGGVVGGAEYSVTSTGDCGSCTMGSSGLDISCSNWMASGQTCTFTSQTTTTDCGFTSEMSETETVELRVPLPPEVTVVPAYNSSTETILAIRTEIRESLFTDPVEVCAGISNSVTHFLLEYTSSSGTVCSSRQLPVADCEDGVCVDVFNVTSGCPGDSYTVSVVAVNVVGQGQAVQREVAFSTRLLTVIVDVSRRVLVCQFAEVGSISCSIRYRSDPGCVQESLTDMNSTSSGSVLFLPLPTDLVDNGLYCYTVTASIGGQTVQLNDEFRSACPRVSGPSSGRVTFTDSSLSPGTVATYSCDSGYELSGDNTRLCQTNGLWSGETPVCRVRTDTVVGITFILTFLFSLALGVIIGVISVLLCIKLRRVQPPKSDIELQDPPQPSGGGIDEEPEVMKKEPEDIQTTGKDSLQ